MQTEFWKQFVGSILRKLLTLLAGILVAKWSVSQEIVNYITSDATVATVAGFVLLLLGVLWTWAKTKFNVNFVNAAAAAPSPVHLGEVKQIAKQKSTFQTSI